jgi:hypothetical protein
MIILYFLALFVLFVLFSHLSDSSELFMRKKV